MTTCAACSQQAKALDVLATSFRADTFHMDELYVRRERMRLLAAFDGSLVASEIHDTRRSFDRHPLDARTEDAVYLRIVALQRASDGSAMHEEARE
ncbi:hypothetical protein AKJ09_07992 [Labilithrix luteola]|uniref:Uncharacterized protein n=1 Tax=Labilithrix luteola TaxID=1391654 RepID=A0A0K1Q6J0_9BACT|nr:hypothetical protein [Labilithrix luteola]AKV01329.1 hypothetical protein AKJ09_07992 [Labilithrix luteola]